MNWTWTLAIRSETAGPMRIRGSKRPFRRWGVAQLRGATFWTASASDLLSKTLVKGPESIQGLIRFVEETSKRRRERKRVLLPIRPHTWRRKKSSRSVRPTLPDALVDHAGQKLRMHVLHVAEEGGHREAELQSLDGFETVEIRRTRDQDPTDLGIEAQFATPVRHIADDSLITVRSRRDGILSDLDGKVDERHQHTDATQEVAEISEHFEHEETSPDGPDRRPRGPSQGFA
jgi:hypothetical protein